MFNAFMNCVVLGVNLIMGAGLGKEDLIILLNDF
jgi:hypothetical protein